MGLASMDLAQYTGHSFRIGAATSAAQVGLSDSPIQILGRWRSSAFQHYLRTLVSNWFQSLKQSYKHINHDWTIADSDWHDLAIWAFALLDCQCVVFANHYTLCDTYAGFGLISWSMHDGPRARGHSNRQVDGGEKVWEYKGIYRSVIGLGVYSAAHYIVFGGCQMDTHSLWADACMLAEVVLPTNQAMQGGGPGMGGATWDTVRLLVPRKASMNNHTPAVEFSGLLVNLAHKAHSLCKHHPREWPTWLLPIQSPFC